MANFRLPGPVCRFLGAHRIDFGTLCRTQSPVPSPILPAPRGQSNRAATSPNAGSSETGNEAPMPMASDNEAMVASDNAALFIASFEAMGFICPDLKVRAYQDGGCNKGNWTVGIGEMSGKSKDSVFETEEKAYKSFVEKVKGDYTTRVRQALKNAGVKRQLRQYEFDALVDLAYQKGNCIALAKSIAAKDAVTEKDFTTQTDGHEARRTAEYNLYSGKQVVVKG